MKTAGVVAARRFLLIVIFSSTGTAWAGARIDLRPTPNLPTYAPNQIVAVDVYVVDTGNPSVGDIYVRGVQFDFSDTGGTLNAQVDNPFFDWDVGFCFPSCGFSNYPTTSWIWPIAWPNMFMIIIPNNGEAKVGDFHVNVGAGGGLIDVMNADETNPNFGAFLTFGFGGPGDPVTLWRPDTGELTGGTLALNVPEPGSLILLAMGVITCARRRMWMHDPNPQRQREVWTGRSRFQL